CLVGDIILISTFFHFCVLAFLRTLYFFPDFWGQYTYFHPVGFLAFLGTVYLFPPRRFPAPLLRSQLSSRQPFQSGHKRLLSQRSTGLAMAANTLPISRLIHRQVIAPIPDSIEHRTHADQWIVHAVEMSPCARPGPIPGIAA